MTTAVQDHQASIITDENPSEHLLETLARLALSTRVYRSADGRLYAEVSTGSLLGIAELRSSRFRDWLARRCLEDQGCVPSAWAVRDVVGALEDRARFDSDIPSLFVRVGSGTGTEGDGGACYLDMGDAAGRAIRIRGEGWSVVGRPAVRFRRPEGMLPLPIPSQEGSIELLRPYVNLGEPDFRQLIVWLTAALRPAGPYPILRCTANKAQPRAPWPSSFGSSSIRRCARSWPSRGTRASSSPQSSTAGCWLTIT